MPWTGEGGAKRWEPDYRVVERDGWFIAMQSHIVRNKERWFSLNRGGYWVDPDQWNVEPEDGEDIVCLMQTREIADAAIAKARKSNAST